MNMSPFYAHGVQKNDTSSFSDAAVDTHDPPCFRGSEGPLNDDDDDSDIEMESTNEVVLPHLRMHCTQFAMPPLNQQVGQCVTQAFVADSCVTF